MKLRIAETENLPLLSEWFIDPEVSGQYTPLVQFSKKAIEYEDKRLQRAQD
jgi:hypothetical protein